MVQTDNKATTLTATERRELRRVIGQLGEVGAAERLGVSRGSVLRALGGLPVRRGTMSLLRAGMGE